MDRSVLNPLGFWVILHEKPFFGHHPLLGLAPPLGRPTFFPHLLPRESDTLMPSWHSLLSASPSISSIKWKDRKRGIWCSTTFGAQNFQAWFFFDAVFH
mmetsp:Transcript_100697/g.173972  ORF Transcript_100697/g.173972 Transcript_100697/m.173972 type:complete len:99 (+) Transcript_100697:113-409(+)